MLVSNTQCSKTVIQQPYRGEDCIAVSVKGRKLLYCEFLQGDGANCKNSHSWHI